MAFSTLWHWYRTISSVFVFTHKRSTAKYTYKRKTNVFYEFSVDILFVDDASESALLDIRKISLRPPIDGYWLSRLHMLCAFHKYSNIVALNGLLCCVTCRTCACDDDGDDLSRVLVRSPNKQNSIVAVRAKIHPLIFGANFVGLPNLLDSRQLRNDFAMILLASIEN